MNEAGLFAAFWFGIATGIALRGLAGWLKRRSDKKSSRIESAEQGISTLYGLHSDQMRSWFNISGRLSMFMLDVSKERRDTHAKYDALARALGWEHVDAVPGQSLAGWKRIGKDRA